MSVKTKRICARVTPEIQDELQLTCEKMGVTASQLVETAVITFLANNGNDDSAVVKDIRTKYKPVTREVTVWHRPIGI